MNKEELLQEVLPYLVTYVQDGIVNIAPYVNEALHIEQLSDLLKLAIYKQHVTLQFMRAFTADAQSMRHRQTTTETHIGEVRGAICWQPTIEKQITHSKQHVVVARSTDAQDAERQVVEAVAYTLRTSYERDTFLRTFHSRSWYAPFIEAMPAFLREAAYVKRPRMTASPRILSRMEQHRQPLYRHAAKLYRQLHAYEQRRYDATLLQQALTEFFIVPKHTDMLFELYWIVQMMKQQRDVTFHMNDGKTRPLASWQQQRTTVTIYHNKATTPHTQFQTAFHELNSAHPFVQATKRAAMQFNEAAHTLFQRKQTDFIWRGRPDFIVEYVKDGTLTHVVIGEVKYTASEAYIQSGLAQLLRYMHFMKTTSQPQVYGLLCVNDYAPMHYDNIQLLSANHDSTMQLPKLEE